MEAHTLLDLRMNSIHLLNMIHSPGFTFSPKVPIRTPTLIRIEAIHTLEEFERLWPEIFFIDDAVLAHDEGLNSSVPVLCRRSDEGEAANHHALDDVIQLAQRRGRPLTFQNFEEVTVIRFGATAVA
jgi:hypothetical protein